MGERDDAEQLEERLERLERELAAAREQAAQWREVAEERRVAMERFRQHPVIRAVFRVAEVVLPPVRRTRGHLRSLAPHVRRVRRTVGRVRSLPAILAAPAREARLRRAVAALPDPPADDRLVTIVVLTHDGERNLRRLLPALRDVPAGARTEVVVVDNGSAEPTRRLLAETDGIRVVRSETNRSFSDGNALGAAEASPDSAALLFLNDDIEPLSPGWVGRMLRELHGDVVAVGAQLVYPARGLAAGNGEDLTIQHRGITFDPVPGGVPAARNLGGGEPAPAAPSVDVPAATAAALLVDRAAFEDVGGFASGYEYGAEDVDLCIRLRGAGGRIRVASDAVLFHHEGATRLAMADAARLERQARNWDRLARSHGPTLTRAVEADRLLGEHRWTDRPYELAITITRDLPEAGYGDWFTAHELGAELERLGWRIRYVERYRDAWYDLPDSVDAVLVLLDTFDVRKVERPGLTTIAWIRNWGDRWVAHPWFDRYDVVLASSEVLARRIEASSRHTPVVMPLATNPDRFRPTGAEREGVLLPVNHWGDDRGVPDLRARVEDLQVVGGGWEDVPGMEDVRPVPYDDLPARYAQAEVVVDVASPHTLDDASVNARVFDALAAGAMVLSEQRAGVEEVFGEGAIPTFADATEAQATLAELRRDPEALQERVRSLRDRVLRDHTYAARAEQLRAALLDRAALPGFHLRIGAPDARTAEMWGDQHLAEALASELRVRGHRTRISAQDAWQDRDGYAFDVALHLKGRGRVECSPGQLDVVWNISHPDELTDEECEEADLVLVAGPRFAPALRERTSTPVDVLLQATDTRRFRPGPTQDRYAHDVVFVGNSKSIHRPVIRYAVEGDLSPAIYGRGWEKFVAPSLLHGSFVPNEELPLVYRSSRVVLNDHWDDMRRWGFVSNRVFDVLACGGGVLVSDHLPELDELLDGAVVTYRSPEELRDEVRALLADPERRRELATRGRELVLAHHTMAHRAEELLSHVTPLVRGGASPEPVAGAEERPA